MNVAMTGTQAASRPACRGWLRQQLGVLAIGALSVSACLAVASPALSAAWELNRQAVADGQVWRLVTGHLTHWNFNHLLWDVATFFALGLACVARSPRRTAACIAGSAIAVSVTVLAGHPELANYRGLSGVDSGLFALLAASVGLEARRHRNPLLQGAASMMLLGFLGKTAFEVATGATLFVDSDAADFVPLASSHAAGAATGLLAAVARFSPTRRGDCP